jgi:hypothetical protein
MMLQQKEIIKKIVYNYAACNFCQKQTPQQLRNEGILQQRLYTVPVLFKQVTCFTYFLNTEFKVTLKTGIM